MAFTLTNPLPTGTTIDPISQTELYNISFCSYVSHPEAGTKVTNEWLKSGTYQLESMGHKIPAKLHLKSPFDANNARVKVKPLVLIQGSRQNMTHTGVSG